MRGLVRCPSMWGRGCPVRPRWVAGDDGEASLLWVFLTKGVGWYTSELLQSLLISQKCTQKDSWVCVILFVRSSWVR